MKSDISGDKQRKEKHNRKSVHMGWILFIFLMTIVISAVFSLVSSTLLSGANILAAFVILLIIILIGILFDIIGVAVTAADPKPFHAMAAHRVSGAKEALKMIGSADKVSSFCNDVVGDICGVISGTASASIVLLMITGIGDIPGLSRGLEIAMAAVVSGLTVGGKAIGKAMAISKSTEILHATALVVYYIRSAPKKLRGLFKKR